MDHPSARRGWRTSSILLGVLVIGLLVTIAMAPEYVRTGLSGTIQVLIVWLGLTRWVWPLAAALTFAALATPPARRRWPQPARRLAAALGVFAGLVGLTGLLMAGQYRVVMLALGILVVGLLAAWVVVVPSRLAPAVPQKELDRLSDDRHRLEVTDARVKLQNDLRTTALQAIAGLAVLAGALLAFQQLTEDREQAAATRELTLQGQASERFTRAIDQLGSNRREVQLGGIYGLEQIAKQAPTNRLAVAEVLVAYLHRRVPRPAKPPPPGSVEELRIRAPDVQAILTVLARRRVTEDDPSLDLRALDLRRSDLTGADLTRALLSDSDLSGAYLGSVNLNNTDLSRADLRHADLNSAYLRGAIFNGARLQGAAFPNALRDVDLRNADLSGTDLSGMDLSRVRLRGAIADQRTLWPNGFDWRAAGVSERRSARP